MLKTTGQVAQALGVSRSSVRRWAADGRLPAVVTLGGHLRFDEHKLARQLGVLSQEAPKAA